jgi:plasmid stabilization system protein ParE
MVRRRYSVIWEDEAKNSLRRIYNYIKNRESVNQAKKVRNAIKELAGSLGFLPRKFAKDPLLENEMGEFRFKAIWSYKIVYEVTEKEVIILDIFHTCRNPEEMGKVKRK